MCIICDGATQEEALASLHDKKKRYGFVIQYVEPSPEGAAWAYTIGLIERLEHPELVVVGLGPHETAHLMDDLVGRIERGQRFGGESVALLRDRSVVRFVPVHPAQFAMGLMTSWESMYTVYGPFDLELRALQVLPCGEQRVWRPRPMPRLDRATTILASRPNRAQRRAQQRAQSRRRPRGR